MHINKRRVFKIVRYKSIDKKLTKDIYFIENKIKKDLWHADINRIVFNKIKKEASLFGMAKIICEQIVFLNKKKLIAKNKNILERINRQLLYLYIQLYRVNHHIHEALLMELKYGAKLLRNKVTKKIGIFSVYKDFVLKIKNTAKLLVKESKYHIRNYYSSTTNKRVHLALAMRTIVELATLNELLRREDHVIYFRRILLKKTINTFKKLFVLSNRNTKLISAIIKKYEKKKNILSDEGYRNVSIVDNQIKILHNFALQFNNYIIHNEPFYVGKKKHILITHDVKPHN